MRRKTERESTPKEIEAKVLISVLLTLALLIASGICNPATNTMEDQCSPFGWEFYFQEEGIEELRHSLLYTTLELETTILSAKEKISRREEDLVHLKDLLSIAIKEKDEAQAQCRRLMLDKLMLQQQVQKQQQQLQLQEVASQNEEESKGSDSNKHFASSCSDESINASPNGDPIVPPPQPALSSSPLPQAALKLAAEKPLPEKGKLLQAVIEAGPLLQNLLLAGPLPQWQHPPPQLKSTEIPPVAISPPTTHLLHQDSCISTNMSCFSNKRSLCDIGNSDLSSPPNTKYQKLVLH